VVRYLTPLLGPCPRKFIPIQIYFPPGSSPPTRPSVLSARPGITLTGDAARAASHPEFFPTVLPSEVARQWFLNPGMDTHLIPSALVETLSQYLAWRYVLMTNPEAARTIVAQAMRDSVAQPVRQPLSTLSGPFALPILLLRGTDERGLLVMRTLETVIDRERVDRVLPEYVRRYGRRPFSVGDFQRVCEEVAGRKLGWFFRYFFNGTGIPSIELRSLPSETPGVAAGEIVIKGLPAEGSVRVEMAIRTAQGVVDHSVATRGTVTPFSVNVPAPVSGITLDPDQRILRWTEAAQRSKTQTAILAALPNVVAPNDLPAAIDFHRKALAADPDDASGRAQSLRERLGELERAHGEWARAAADFEAALNGHSISPFETYLWRGKAYLHHGEAELHQGRAKEALEDARAGLALPQAVLDEWAGSGLDRKRPPQTLQQALESLRDLSLRH